MSTRSYDHDLDLRRKVITFLEKGNVQLEQAVGALRPWRVFSGKDYARKANRAMLRSKGIRQDICYNARVPAKPLATEL
jgi:hypothetical protein